MARAITDPLRPFMFLWLLLTVPVVCHHETAVALLGALGTGHGQHHLAGVQAHQHAQHATTRLANATTAPDRAVTIRLAGGPSAAPEWCVDHGSGVRDGMPAGLDGLASLDDPGLPAPAPGPAIAHEVAIIISASRTPPAPPPRLLG